MEVSSLLLFHLHCHLMVDFALGIRPECFFLRNAYVPMFYVNRISMILWIPISNIVYPIQYTMMFYLKEEMPLLCFPPFFDYGIVQSEWKTK